jgi:hypothetical protein
MMFEGLNSEASAGDALSLILAPSLGLVIRGKAHLSPDPPVTYGPCRAAQRAKWVGPSVVPLNNQKKSSN